MQTGRLRHRVTIQEEQITRDTAGGEVIIWANVATVWAEVRGSRAAREGFVSSADQVQAIAAYTVRIRKRSPWPDVKNRVLWNNLTFDIQNVIDPDGRGRELHLMCEAVV